MRKWPSTSLDGGADDSVRLIWKLQDHRPELALERSFHLIRETAARLGLRNARVLDSVARDGYDSDIDLLVTPDEDEPAGADAKPNGKSNRSQAERPLRRVIIRPTTPPESS